MKERYSKYTKYILLLIDLLIINGVTLLLLKPTDINIYFYLFISAIWVISAFSAKFYNIYRYTGSLKLLRLLTTQLATFILGYFAYFGIFKEGKIVHSQFNSILSIVILICLVKITVFFALKIYRKSGKNYRNVIFVGIDDTSKRIIKLFKSQEDLGYNYKGFFSNTFSENNDYLGEISHLKNYLTTNVIHEVYVTLSEFEKTTVKQLTQLTNETNTTLKLIPDATELYSKSQETEFYNDTFQILKVKKLPFEYPENHLLKRIFDIIFSFFVILFLMSWLTPILWILIKLESKGPLFFKQEREGLNGKKFVCYKFRSMKKNKMANKVHATKNDVRVTRIGKFIRKTSIDEFPQFYNVFLGDMSIVGPRPHMESLAIEYQKDVDNYIERHAVKPGITGLAQVSGYRGEIKQKSDIKNRIRFDIFYIENWSFLLDIKIIIKTVLNIFKGEENAY